MRRIVLQYLPVLLFCLWLKGCRTAILLPELGPAALADSLGVELGVHLAVLGFAGLALVALPRRAAAIAVQLGLGLVAVALILLELVALTFAWETGGALDHHLFRHALANLLAMLPLIYAEVDPPRIASVAMIVVAVVGLRLWQVLRQTLPPIDPRAPAALLVVGLLLIALLPVGVPARVAASMPVELVLGPRLDPVQAATGAALRLPPHAADATLEPLDGAPPFDHLVVVALESTGLFATSLAAGGPDTTPVLRRLADGGVLFDRAYAIVPHSSKALVGINCGIAPFLLMQVRESLPRGVPVKCLPALLRERGFQTLYLGAHVGDFEGWIPLMRNLGFAVSLTAERLDLSRYERVNYFAWEDDALLEPTRLWLQRAQGKRLFAFYLTSAAHHDYRVPSHVALQPFAEDEKHNRYLNAVATQDRFLGRLLEIYREEGLAERTLFVVLGDHGEAFGEHGRTLHDHVIYEEGIRVPLVLFGEGLAPEVRGAVVSQLDLLPTLVELLGFRIRGGSYEGENLFTRGPEAVAYSSCFYSERCLARVDAQRKIISHFDHGAPEAYAIGDDPRETRDVFGEDPEDEARLRDLHDWKEQRLGRYLRHYGQATP